MVDTDRHKINEEERKAAVGQRRLSTTGASDDSICFVTAEMKDRVKWLMIPNDGMSKHSFSFNRRHEFELQ